MSRCQRENEALKSKLLLMERELRDVRGHEERIPDNSFSISFEVAVCDDGGEVHRRTTKDVENILMEKNRKGMEMLNVKHEPEDGEQNSKTSQPQEEQEICPWESTSGTPGAAVANSAEGPLCKVEELHMQPCLMGHLEKGLQAELKLEPQGEPLPPAVPLLPSADSGLEIEHVWSKSGIIWEKHGQHRERTESRNDQLDHLSPQRLGTPWRLRSQRDEGTTLHVNQQQNDHPLPHGDPQQNGCPHVNQQQNGRPLAHVHQQENGHSLVHVNQQQNGRPLAHVDQQQNGRPLAHVEHQQNSYPLPHVDQQQNDCPFVEEGSQGLPDLSSEVAFPRGSQVESNVTTPPCKVGSSVSAEAKRSRRIVEQAKVISDHTLKILPGALELKPHSFRCSQCGKSFADSSKLKNHQQSHQRKKQHVCTECGKFFFLRNDLEIHQRVHTREKPYLKTDQVTDTREKCFRCTVCNESFAFLNALKHHQMFHLGQRLHHCKVCQKSFSRLCNLKIHLRIHTGEKPYSCEECGKRFSDLSNLKSHYRVHTGEKPFTCTVCSKGFSRNRSLQRHMPTHSKK
ncbi:hypothetical protein GJAV_G00249500 [Gymnothorax javanicus]|nr:hypothetical protein GJAV_G00249500 [Gymnothorax javanicus]